MTRLNIGGPARQALLLTKALNHKFPSILVAGRPTSVEGELTDPDIEPIRLPLVRRISPLNDSMAFRGLRRLMEKEQPKLVHTHMAKAGTLARLAASRGQARPKLVHTYHGHVLKGYFSSAATKVFLDVERRLARRTDVLVAVSQEMRDELLGLGVGRPDQYRVIPVGIDLSRHALVKGSDASLRQRTGTAAGRPLIGIVGRLAPVKDHEVLLQAMLNLPDVDLAIIGDGELRNQLQSRSVDLGLANRIHFTGWLSDVPGLMRGLDLVVLTSRNEGTPVSLIEALACGRPVVATDVGGVRSVVKNGLTGVLVGDRNPESIATAISESLKDAERSHRLAESGRQDVLRRFSAGRVVSDIEALYRELI
ncbi:MAG: glycosyltransferase family 4 protein [Actinomycetota bacterium]